MTTEVLIAIQARSNSTRFPGKIYQKVGNRRVLDMVIDQATSAANHINRKPGKIDIRCQVAVLHPDGDTELVNAFNSSGCLMIPGPEQDVLTRYVNAMNRCGSDYIVRLTSDCPLMLDYVVVKHIYVAAFNCLDYVSNIEESCRFVADGFDCEIISKKAINWLNENAKSDFDREHVTTLIRKERPRSLTQGFVSLKIDSSDMKMSVDTPEDLERIREYYHRREGKMNTAKRLFGKCIYEL